MTAPAHSTRIGPIVAYSAVLGSWLALSVLLWWSSRNEGFSSTMVNPTGRADALDNQIIGIFWCLHSVVCIIVAVAVYHRRFDLLTMLLVSPILAVLAFLGIEENWSHPSWYTIICVVSMGHMVGIAATLGWWVIKALALRYRRYRSDVRARATACADPAINKLPLRWGSLPLSVRMFVAISALVAVGSGLWVGVPAYQQHVALTEIASRGGKFTLVPIGPPWLRSFAGADRMRAFDRVWALDFFGASVTDKTLRFVENMTSLHQLSLGKTDVTDAGMARLSRLKSLELLRLDDTRVTDAGLAHLRDMTSLEYLSLTQTQVTDAGLKYLEGMSKLEHLDLWKTRISDTGLAHLRDLTNLETLSLSDTKVTDAGLAQLKGLSSLKVIWLNKTDVTDAGLVHLKELRALTGLELGDTQVTDAGLAHLKELTNLQFLRVENTQVTDAGLTELSRVLPNLRVLGWRRPGTEK